MKLQVLREKLNYGINIVSRTIAKTTSLPILEGIMVKAEKNFLHLTATDLEVAIDWWALAKVEKEGEIVIPARNFSNLIKSITSSKLSLQSNKESLLIQDKISKNSLQGLKVEEFPLIPGIEEKECLELNSADFCHGLEQVVNCVALSETRPEISGIYLNFSKDKVLIAATDSFRLSQKTILLKSKNTIKKSIGLILPHKTAQHLIAVLADENQSIKICFSSGQILFETPMTETEHPRVRIISRLVEGSYPEYQEIIPKKYNFVLRVDRKDFLSRVKTASVFSDRVNEVKLNISSKEKKLIIEAQSARIGKSESSLPIELKGDDLKISFDCRFLTDALTNINSKEVVLSFVDEEKACLIKSAEDDSYFYILMPIKS